ncbi:hypothetical protein L7F22_008456 [Adiantum nelumboides]|nr:hypothetical protein [Adiantum nelumboides]
MKFIVELQELQFSFLVEESTRSTLANFLTYKEAPLLVKEDTLKKPHMEAPDIDNAFLLFFDGSYRKSHNEASGGVVIYDPQAWSLRHIDRSHNEEAHAAAQAMIGQLYVIRADSPLYLGRESLEREGGFLQTDLLPAELEKSKKHAFLRRAKRYMLVGDSLYMKGTDLVMRRVPWKEEIYKVLEENHEGSCGGHFASKITLHKILQEGYVWPSIQRDVHHWCKSCKECQSMASRVLRSKIRDTILAYDVFEKWGVDAIGPLPITARVQFCQQILYFVNWVNFLQTVKSLVLVSFCSDSFATGSLVQDLNLSSRFETVQISVQDWFYNYNWSLVSSGLLVSSVWFKFLNLVWFGSVTGSAVHWSDSAVQLVQQYRFKFWFWTGSNLCNWLVLSPVRQQFRFQVLDWFSSLVSSVSGQTAFQVSDSGLVQISVTGKDDDCLDFLHV